MNSHLILSEPNREKEYVAPFSILDLVIQNSHSYSRSQTSPSYGRKNESQYHLSKHAKNNLS